MAKKKPTPTQLKAEDLAEQYGWSMSVLKAYPEVWGLFQNAIKSNWSSDKFIAKLRATKWFQSRSKAQQQSAILKRAHPEEYEAQTKAKMAMIGDMMGSMGVRLSGKGFGNTVRAAVDLGLNDAEIRNILGRYVKEQRGTLHWGGQAGVDEESIREFGRQMGVGVTQATLRSWIKSIAIGSATPDTIKQYIRAQAEKQYSMYSDDIKNGVSVMEIASPYIQSMGQVLEVNSNTLDPMDPTIRKALTRMGDNGKPTQVPVWQFEQELRKDPRWKQTKNAQDSLMAAGHQVLQDFGVVH